MSQNQLLEDEAINLLNARFPEESRPKRRSSMIAKGSKTLTKELKMNPYEARALAEIWADREELIIDREPYEIIGLLEAESAKAKKAKRAIWIFVGIFLAIIIVSIATGNASNIASFGGMFGALGGAAVLGGRSQIAMRYPEKLRRPEAVIPLAEAYRASAKAGRTAALSSLIGALDSCVEAESLEPAVSAEIERLSKKGPDEQVRAAAARTLAAIQNKSLAARPSGIDQNRGEDLHENA
jgi:hypothetical protein